MISVKLLIGAYLRFQAQQRTTDTDNPGNGYARTALALREAARFIESLPDDDLRLRRVDAACAISRVGQFQPGPLAGQLIRSWGAAPDNLDGPPDWFVDLLAERCIEDAIEATRRRH